MYLNQILECDPSLEIDPKENTNNGNAKTFTSEQLHQNNNNVTDTCKNHNDNPKLKVSNSKAELKQTYKKCHQVIK